MPSASELFQAAYEDFQKRLTHKERDEFKFTTLHDLEMEVGRIQKDQESSKEMMNMARIESFLEAMSQYGEVVEVFLNNTPFLAYVWGPMKFLLQTARNWSDTFEIILDAYEQIGEQLPLLRQYKGVFANEHMRRVLGYIFHDILEFHKRAIRFCSGRVWHQVFRSAWKDFGTRFKYILDRLRRHRELIQHQASIIHQQMYERNSRGIINRLDQHQQMYEKNSQGIIYRLDQHQEIYEYDSQGILDRLDQHQDKMDEILQKLVSTEEAHRKEQYQKTLEWIAGPDSSQDHELCLIDRHDYPETGSWILRHEKVQPWVAAETPVSSILWLNGIPGAGKTILASVIVDHCIKSESIVTGYFYCKDDPEKNTCMGVFKGILSQLLTQCRDSYPELLAHIHENINSSGEVNLSSSSVVMRLLGLFFERISKKYIIIVIDGLDECEQTQRKILLSFFTSEVNKIDAIVPGKLRVLFVSQDYNDIARQLPTPTASIMSLGPDDNAKDIRIYVDRWTQKIQKEFQITDQDAGRIKELTCGRAQGMFLFAKLVMENLFGQHNRQRLLREIEGDMFPKKLKHAYERIMNRIRNVSEDEDWELAQKLLGWMVCAKRPLKWFEIQGAVSIDRDSETVKFDDLSLRKHINDICGSLVKIYPGDRVELVHSTAKTHIVNTGYIRAEVVECRLAALCLQYLSFECFDKRIDDDQLRGFILQGHFAFQDYAIAKWFYHLLSVIDSGDSLSRQKRDRETEMGRNNAEYGRQNMEMERQTALEEIDIALESFYAIYEDELPDEVNEICKKTCAPFKDHPFYQRLLLLAAHVYEYQGKDSKARNEISIKPLRESLIRNRNWIEEKYAPNAQCAEKNPISAFYGTKWFKCPKIGCFYFHEGFNDSKTRDKHIAKHDRPFGCEVPDCSIAEFGFTVRGDLDRHMKSFHPDVEYEASTFSTPKTVPAKTPYKCNMCDKAFTRNFHLRSHIRSHNGERPFPCSKCGKAFTRANDCRRHEKIHNKEVYR